MPKGSTNSENVHFDFRGRTGDTSTSTINSVGSVKAASVRSSPTTSVTGNFIGSAKTGPFNNHQYSNIQIDSSKTLILSKFFNTSSSGGADSIPAYENLCSGCGYGVFGARGDLCNFCQYVLNGCPQDNIYENICDKCSQLFSGDECLACLSLENNKNKHINTHKYDNTNTNVNVNSSCSKKKKLKKRLIHSLLGSLKRVKSFNASTPLSSSLSSPQRQTPSSSSSLGNVKSPIRNRKLQIVHNVDGFENVFCTNETFDLNRICELKQQQKQQKQQLKASTSDHHIYGKLRISEDDHLHQARFKCIKQKSQSDDYLISASGGIGIGIEIADNSSVYCSTSLNSHDSFDIDNNNYSLSSSSYLHIRSSVSEWMTSLRCETHDYYSFGAPDTILSNPKSIPGNFAEFCAASSFVFYPKHKYLAYGYDHQMQTKSESLSRQVDAEFTQQMVNEFKRNLMEKPGPHNSVAYQQQLKTKRHGIHLKLDDIENKQLKLPELQQQRVQNNFHPVDVNFNFNVNANVNDDNLVRMVGDHHQQQRNVAAESNNNYYCLLQPSAQAQAIALAAGLNGGRREPEHQLNKRCCIYEKDSDFVSDILQVFDSILLRESNNNSPSSSSSSSSLSSSSCVPQKTNELKNCENNQVVNEIFSNVAPHSETSSDSKILCSVSVTVSSQSRTQQINLEQIICELVLSKSLNKLVITYEIPLKWFLSGVSNSAYLSKQLPYSPTLKKIFRRFQVFLSRKQKQNTPVRMRVVSSDRCVSSASVARSLETSQPERAIPSAIENNYIIKRKAPLPPPLPPPLRKDSLNSNSNAKMTVPNGTSNTKADNEEKEEPIYQPIWKFKTLGEVQQTDITDVYFDDHHRNLPRRCDSYTSLSETDRADDVEDLDEWEPDDEFTFTTKLVARASAAAGGGGGGDKEADTISVNTIQSSVSGSTITGYASSVSTMTLASASSTSSAVGGNFTHHLFRNICIFYSPKNPKLRAVLYEYDRNRCSSYFAHQMPPSVPLLMPASSTSSSSLSLSSSSSPSFIKKTRRGGVNCGGIDTNGSTSTPTTSADYYYDRDAAAVKRSPCDGNKFSKKSSESASQILADSVQAWKYLLLDVNYLEDEEDMIVSESQILKAQTIKEMDSTLPQVGVLQKFKSISSGNLLDIPVQEDKKSIAERMKNKFQRSALLKISPKAGKKSRKMLKGNEATSLYLEDGIQPKYPIFKAPLELLEMNETSYPDVPRFVVDCIEYIEQKDCIQMDGLYRASGNKLAIDELKQKLTESYIYDPKLLVTDDIHTLTSLLKLFFRELGSPLIPHDTYKSFPPTKNLMEPSAIEDIKKSLQTMQKPNRETLKFLIKHLTTVAHYSSENRMPASNLAIVWGPCILAINQIEFDIARMNTIAKVLIENYDKIFGDNERLVS
ncbi:uncharacterized protein LOC129944066 [Eupeodes corollae]|uniref:uncharacterized protein LOC129944066 n=1 Tax=Eupeodes corollae TaxID=290404 RepID=UPI00248FE384|nr:uncharacterized protein LOC129944066 [Eupeodes corollae]